MPSPTLPSLRRSRSSIPFVPVSTLHLPRYKIYPAGHPTHANQSVCVPCPAGRFKATGLNSKCGICQICPSGTWSWLGMSYCNTTSCASGTHPRFEAVVDPSSAKPLPRNIHHDRSKPMATLVFKAILVGYNTTSMSTPARLDGAATVIAKLLDTYVYLSTSMRREKGGGL